MQNINEMPVSEVVQKSGLKHIAFIMDGNGRWAKAKGLPREVGHKAGAENFKKIVRYSKSIGIGCCTVYAFSTENIKRPKHEVEAIFKLFLEYIKEAADEKDIEFRFIGEPSQLSSNIGEKAKALEDETRGRPYRLNIAMNYGGRAEIVNAVNRLIVENNLLRSSVYAKDTTNINQTRKYLTEEDIDSALYTAGCPDPDLVVRTGNEQRISNFLLWQCAYSEYYFSDKMWPDFSPADVDCAVYDFASRSRRWGNV